MYNTILPITKQHLTNKTTRPGSKLLKHSKVVIHYTGNTNIGANAMANRNYFNTTKNYASTQYIVDDKNIIECMPWNEVAWAVGGSSYTSLGKSLHVNGKTPNYSTSSIEMCVNGDVDYHKVVENTVSLTVWLLLQMKLTPKDVCRHYDITGKQCPLYYLDKVEWSTFLAKIEDLYTRVIKNQSTKFTYSPMFAVEIIIDGLNVRKGPTTSYQAVTKLNKGDIVNVYEKVYGWYRTDKGWFSASTSYSKRTNSVVEQPSEPEELKLQGVVTASTLNIRSTPNSSNSSNIVGKYNKNDLVILLDKSGDWYKTDKGWIHGGYLTITELEEDNITLYHSVKLYDASGKVLAQIPEREELVMFEEEKTINGVRHIKVQYDTLVGYINPSVYENI